MADLATEVALLNVNATALLQKYDGAFTALGAAGDLIKLELEAVIVDAENRLENSIVVSTTAITGNDIVVNSYSTDFTFNAIAYLGGTIEVAQFEIDWGDGTAIQTVPATSSAALAGHVFADGALGATYTVKATAIDTLGNKGAQATKTVTIADNHAPTPPTVTSTTEVSKLKTFDITIAGSTDADGDSITYSLSSSNFTFSKATGIVANEVITVTAPDVTADTAYTFDTVAVDAKGMASTTVVTTVTVLSITYGDVGIAGEKGFGVGIAPSLPTGFSEMVGSTDVNSANYGNYTDASGSVMVYIPKCYYKIVDNNIFYSSTPQVGYDLERAFIDGGVEHDGIFVDKYGCGNEAGVFVSKQGIDPVSTNSAHNPISAINGCTADTYEQVFNAVKSRGVDYGVTPIFVFTMLARMSVAHQQAATGTTNCAWNDVAPYAPKGCNNNALADVNDTALTFTTSGYSNCALTGSGSVFAKTTHNGQDNGIADLNGNMYDIASCFTRMTANGFMVLKESISFKDIDLTNHSDIALYDVIDLSDITLNAWVYFGNGTNPVFDMSLRTDIGIPLATGHSAAGTTEFGNDGLYKGEVDTMVPLVGGYWSNTASAGVFYLNLSDVRSASSYAVGGRASVIL
jgi:hypothetical protein